MKQNSDKIAGLCFLGASICYFVCAIIGFIDKGSMAVVHLYLGSCFLCLSSAHFSKDKKNNSNYNLSNSHFMSC